MKAVRGGRWGDAMTRPYEPEAPVNADEYLAAQPPVLGITDALKKMRAGSRQRFARNRARRRSHGPPTTRAATASLRERDVDRDRHGRQDYAEDQQLSQDSPPLRLHGVALLQGVEPRIETVRGDEVFVGARLGDAAVFDHEDRIYAP